MQRSFPVLFFILLPLVSWSQIEIDPASQACAIWRSLGDTSLHSEIEDELRQMDLLVVLSRQQRQEVPCLSLMTSKERARLRALGAKNALRNLLVPILKEARERTGRLPSVSSRDDKSVTTALNVLRELEISIPKEYSAGAVRAVLVRLICQPRSFENLTSVSNWKRIGGFRSDELICPLLKFDGSPRAVSESKDFLRDWVSTALRMDNESEVVYTDETLTQLELHSRFLQSPTEALPEYLVSGPTKKLLERLLCRARAEKERVREAVLWERLTRNDRLLCAREVDLELKDALVDIQGLISKLGKALTDATSAKSAQQYEEVLSVIETVEDRRRERVAEFLSKYSSSVFEYGRSMDPTRYRSPIAYPQEHARKRAFRDLQNGKEIPAAWWTPEVRAAAKEWACSALRDADPERYLLWAALSDSWSQMSSCRVINSWDAEDSRKFFSQLRKYAAAMLRLDCYQNPKTPLHLSIRDGLDRVFE